MRGELDLQDYSRSLGEGLFADNVVVLILEFKDKRALASEEKKTLRRAKDFLDTAIAGGNLQKGVFRSAFDVTAAKAYSSVRQVRPRSTRFLDYIKDRRETINAILNNNQVDENEINELDSFFSGYGRLHYEKMKSVLETT